MLKIKLFVLTLSLFPLMAFASNQYTIRLNPLSYSQMAPGTALSIEVVNASKEHINADVGMISMYNKSISLNANTGPFPQNLFLSVDLIMSFCTKRYLPFAYSSSEELSRCQLQITYQNSFPYTCDTYKVSINKLCR